MLTLPKVFDNPNIPVKLGSPLRVPYYAWKEWGINWEDNDEFQKLIELSEEAYREEWQLTTTERHDEINKAAEQAGLDRANDLLNKQAASIIGKIIGTLPEKIRILDVGAGAGATTISILDVISIEQAKGIELVLLEPVSEALETARTSISSHRLGNVIKCQFIEAPDLDLLDYIEKASVDIAVSVAAIHHHAYLERPFQMIRSVIRKSGYFLIADWHNSMWVDPARVYQMLLQMEWEGKETDLEYFSKIYPSSQGETPMDLSPKEMEANKQISRFWRFYSTLARGREQKFLVLEGHRPTNQYIRLMQSAGFSLDGVSHQDFMSVNPLYLLPGSSLLAIILGRAECNE